jgi:hypothetical protein
MYDLRISEHMRHVPETKHYFIYFIVTSLMSYCMYKKILKTVRKRKFKFIVMSLQKTIHFVRLAI